MSESADTIIDAVTDPDYGRANARKLADRLRFGVTQEERDATKAAIMEAITKGKVKEDGTHQKVGPRTLAILAGAIERMNASDQRDLHHLEGQKVNLTATITKTPDEEAADLLAEMRRGDLTPRAS